MLHKVASAVADPECIALDHLRAALAQLRRLPERADLASVVDFAISALEGKEHFGQLLYQRRKAAGWSPEDLAEKTGLAPNTIRNIENGRTTPAPGTLALLLSLPELQLVAEHAAAPCTTQRPNAHIPPSYDPTRLAQELREMVNGPGGTLEQSYLYLDNQSAADYLAVCEAYNTLRGHQFAQLQRLGECIASEGGPLDVIAIGSGDGRAEVCLAQAIAQSKRLGRLYLLDISHLLLTRALDHSARVLEPMGVEVEAVHGNFHELQRYQVLHARPGAPRRLYTLLGATIANLDDELRFFRDLHSCSAEGDLALVDFQVAHEPEELDPTLRAGAIPPIFFAWHAGPLRRNNPEVRSVTMRPELAPGRLPGSYIIFSVATTQMADGTTRSYRVMSSARYQPERLAESLAATGWRSLDTVPYDGRSASMLLRRM